VKFLGGNASLMPAFGGLEMEKKIKSGQSYQFFVGRKYDQQPLTFRVYQEKR